MYLFTLTVVKNIRHCCFVTEWIGVGGWAGAYLLYEEFRFKQEILFTRCMISITNHPTRACPRSSDVKPIHS